MALTVGDRIGPYEILGLLGAGGMGEVYRAHDPKLHRDVAIKILPALFAADTERVARFEREAQVLASLNHPNIAAIYGLEAGGLVLELVEGPTLADRIAQGPLPLDEVLGVARQIADALEAAHEQGIIHRDLKPANIKMRPDGTVKVLDFGLAKAIQSETASAGNVSLSPTITSPAQTALGVILGTASYMAPEQARGRQADRRSDIWAFGCVLFEMLTGRAPFEGEEVADVLAHVLTQEPDWNALPAATPPALHRLLRRCLTKDRRRRLSDASAVRLEIDEALTAPSQAGVSETRVWTRGRERLVWLATLIVAVAGALGLMRFVESSPPPAVSPVRFPVSGIPDTMVYLPVTTTPFSQPALLPSPDGKHLAFIGRRLPEPTSIWIRSLESLEVRRLPGTEGAGIPFWSADSRSIGFFAAGMLKRIDIAGGSPQPIAPAPAPAGGAWNRDGTIIFAPTLGGQLYQVRATGGSEAAAFTSFDLKSGAPRWPVFLPDGRHFLFMRWPGKVFIGSLDSKDASPLLAADSGARYASGHVLFQREGTLFAQPFDAARLELSGEERPVAQNLGLPFGGGGRFGVTDRVLVYTTSDYGSTELRWLDRRGKHTGTLDTGAIYINPSLSSDGTIVMVGKRNRNQPTFDLWSFDLRSGVPSKFTFDAGVEWLPAWSPDGKYVAYTMDHGTGRHDIYRRLANGAGDDEPVFASDFSKNLTDWTGDGRFLVFEEATETGSDLNYVAVTGDRKRVTYLKTSSNEQNGHVSRDMRWMAYQSDESGRYEVYVRPFPDAKGGRWQISSGGGTDPRWNRDGSELFYFSSDGQLMAASVRPDASGFVVAKTEPLFKVTSTANRTNYSVMPDGQKFLVNAVLESTDPPSITVLVDWETALRARQ